MVSLHITVLSLLHLIPQPLAYISACVQDYSMLDGIYSQSNALFVIQVLLHWN